MRYYIPYYAKLSARRGLKQRKKKKVGKLPVSSIHLSVNKTISKKDARAVANFYARNKNKNTKEINERFMLYGGRKFSRAIWRKLYK
jgi:hypothetical protein